MTGQRTPAVHNSVVIDERGIIQLRYKGAQTQTSLRTLTARLLELMAAQRAAGKKVYVLADMRHITHADSSARLEAKQFLEEADYDALAVVGNRYLQPFIFFVLRDFKSHKAVEYFTREEAAIAWLLAPHLHRDVNRLKPRNRLKWAIFPLIALTLAVTFISWQQAVARLNAEAEKQFASAVQTRTEAIEDRVRIYLEALNGFRGLFHSSQDVDEKEFTDYFRSLELNANYPGFNSINYITRVTEANKASFINEIRTDRSLNPAGNPSFAITPPNNRPEHFVVTYQGVDGATAGKGVDLASNDERRTTLETARDTGNPGATGTIKLLNANGQEQGAAGFLVTIPIYDNEVPTTTEARRAAHQGFVNAVFDHQKLFNQVFDGLNGADLAVTITDAAGERIFQNGQAPTTARAANITVPIAQTTWNMHIAAPQLYGASQSETRLPTYIIFMGLLLTLFLTVVFWLLNRNRQRAIDLASAMTEDIKQERNNAIATKNKDEAILSSIGDAVLVVDTAGTITLFNRAAEIISGYAAKEAIGMPYQKILPFYNEKDGKPADGFIKRALAGKKTEMDRGTWLRRKDNQSSPVADSAAPVLDATGQMIGAVVVFRDITRERQLERMKEEFLSIASHELRTPMGAIRANVAMILSGDYGPVNKGLVEPLTDIKASTVRLVDLVNDLLNVTRIEAGRVKFALNDVDIQEVTASTVKSLAPLGKEKNIKIAVTKAKSLLVQADPDKIKQVMTNLVGNSLKFTSKGSIMVTITPQKDMAEIAVTDTGIGITAADQKKLFGKFEQIVSAQDGKPAGTGLGLYISREIIRKMGGELWIKASAPGKGSTFSFTLPLSGTPAAHKAKQVIASEAAVHPDQK